MKQSWLKPALFSFGFAILGSILILFASALTANRYIEPETGTLANGASSIVDDSAANGGAVLFQAPIVGAQPVWQDTFDATLDMTTQSHTGVWRPNDFWQNINRGYRDFAGTSWNLNPNETPGHNPFTISDGVLRITSKRTPAELNSVIQASMVAQEQYGSVPAWAGGMLITNKDVRTFSNGYYEFRVRFPNVGKGMFPALWFYSADGNLNPGKEGAEIDLLEIFGHQDGSIVNSGMHFLASNNVQVRNHFSGSVTGDTMGWHTYALDWQATYLRFYKDDVMYAEATGEDAAWFNGIQMGIRMNYAMDASWFGANASNGTTPNPLYMDIDYVKYYNQKP